MGSICTCRDLTTLKANRPASEAMAYGLEHGTLNRPASDWEAKRAVGKLKTHSSWETSQFNQPLRKDCRGQGEQKPPFSPFRQGAQLQPTVCSSCRGRGQLSALAQSVVEKLPERSGGLGVTPEDHVRSSKLKGRLLEAFWDTN